jgi:hypothetical protein
MRSAFTITWLALCAAAACGAADVKYPELAQVHLVYLAPMGNAFDQYLANRLTQGGRFRVVTDPQIADAILTDRIGESFEAYFATLYPPPPPEKSGDSDSDSDRTVRDEGEARPRATRLGQARGNLYLIDRGSRRVIWSDYRRPRNTQPDQLDELAEYFAARLRKQAGKAVAPPPPPPPPPAPPASAEPKPDTAVPAPK